jgi:hypothetical protein
MISTTLPTLAWCAPLAQEASAVPRVNNATRRIMTTDEGTFSIRANYDKLEQDAECEAVSSENGTDKVRESYGNHDRTGRSGLPANVDCRAP